MRSFVGALLLLAAAHATAQSNAVTLSRAQAVRLATEHAPRMALIRADSLAAAAGLQLARQFENPALSASYSKSTPQAHFSLDVPIERPGTRHARIAASENEIAAATFRRANERAALELDVDTAYSRAQALAARAALSARIARDADSLLRIARVRRDAGDASDLDVELATVFAGQSQNSAANDSVSGIVARAVLQTLIGLPADSATVTLGESIDVAALGTMEQVTIAPVPLTAARDGKTLSNTATSYSVAAAERELNAANYRVLVEQRRRLPSPSLSVGFEAVGPDSNGLLPTVGFALPLPLFNRNAASIQVARAERERAQASVQVAKLAQAYALSNAVRDAQSAGARAGRSSQLVASANRIAALSLVAYREGAAGLSAALDAQRAAREALSQYVDDVATSRIAGSVLRFYMLTSVVPPQ